MVGAADLHEVEAGTAEEGTTAEDTEVATLLVVAIAADIVVVQEATRPIEIPWRQSMPTGSTTGTR